MLYSSFFPNLLVRFVDPQRKAWLVYRQHADALARDGNLEAVPGAEANRVLFGSRLDDASIERFLHQIALRDSLFDAGPSACLHGMRARLEKLVARGTIVALRHSEGGAEDVDTRSLRQEREIARELARLERGKRILAGRRCLFVAGVDFARVPGRERYQVVPKREAAGLLSAAAIAPGLDGESRRLLERAVRLLAPDWREPSTPNGLVLLREMPTVAPVWNPEASLTPSQLRDLIQADQAVKLEVVALGLDDKPLKSVKFTIEAPDGDVHEGDLGSSGRTTITSVDKGTATVTLAWPESPE